MRSERRCICPKLKEFCSIAQEWMDEENETESLRDWYVLFKKLEYLLYDLGIEIYKVTSKNTFPKTRRYGIIESSKDSR